MSESKERPILFSGPMVRAILEGRKTQTRRVAKFTSAGYLKEPSGHRRWHPENPNAVLACPYGAPGDRLWVRETWGCKAADRPGTPDGRKPQPGDSIQYAADEADAWQWRVPGALPWRPSIHMPRWASRITLEILDVRVQWLQEISEEDAIAEGVDAISLADVPRQATWSRRQDFAQLWDRINGKRSPWPSNNWVWAITFRRIKP